MAIHLTPTELAREAGMERREVIEKCMETGVAMRIGVNSGEVVVGVPEARIDEMIDNGKVIKTIIS